MNSLQVRFARRTDNVLAGLNTVSPSGRSGGSNVDQLDGQPAGRSAGWAGFAGDVRYQWALWLQKRPRRGHVIVTMPG